MEGLNRNQLNRAGGLRESLGRNLGLGRSGLSNGHRSGYGGSSISNHRGGCESRGTGRMAIQARMMDSAKISAYNRAGLNHSRLTDGTSGYRSRADGGRLEKLMYEASHDHNMDHIINDVDLIDRIGSSHPHLKYSPHRSNIIEIDREAHEKVRQAKQKAKGFNELNALQQTL